MSSTFQKGLGFRGLGVQGVGEERGTVFLMVMC